MMKTIATINFKGGVGKTTITWCLGDVLNLFENSEVLLFDLDAQMSLTQALSLEAGGAVSGRFDRWLQASRDNDQTILSVLRRFLDNGLVNFHPDEGFVYKINNRYHLVPSTEQLYWLEVENREPERGKFFVKDLMGRILHSRNLPDYDYVLFDCPPSFTMLSYSILTCCDLVLIPFNPDFIRISWHKPSGRGVATKNPAESAAQYGGICKQGKNPRTSYQSSARMDGRCSE